MTDDIWKEMVLLGAATPENRKRREIIGSEKGKEGESDAESSAYGFPTPIKRLDNPNMCSTLIPTRTKKKHPFLS